MISNYMYSISSTLEMMMILFVVAISLIELPWFLVIGHALF